jgi:hypothetical protein
VAAPEVPPDLLPPDASPPLLGCPPLPPVGTLLLLQADRELIAKALKIKQASFVWGLVIGSPLELAARR